MPRRARRYSSVGMYHIILKGINSQTIFEENDDFLYFLKRLEKYKKKYDYKVNAYCLMSNHVHLLVQGNNEQLADFMKSIEISFAYWYNKKYKRQGNVFVDRYKSEPIETERYYITVLKYILWNPVKAGICSSIERYQWSSAK